MNRITKRILMCVSIGIALTAIILCSIFCPKYMGPGSNVKFIGDEISLHEEYRVKVIGVDHYDEISILQSADAPDFYLLSKPGKHYLEVIVELKRQFVSNPRSNHVLKNNNFKAKDHTGVRFKNIFFQSVKDGFALSEKQFSTSKAVADYSWIGLELEPGFSDILIIYFEFDSDLSVFDSVVILEIDFYFGIGKNLGVDILLGNRVE